jgi:hypothetical protein
MNKLDHIYSHKKLSCAIQHAHKLQTSAFNAAETASCHYNLTLKGDVASYLTLIQLTSQSWKLMQAL